MNVIGHLQVIDIYHHTHVSTEKTSVTESFVNLLEIFSALCKHSMQLY